MKALTPVGRFPVRLTGVRAGPKGLLVDAKLGVWRTEVELERRDLPLILGAVGVVALAAALGRASAGGRPGAH